MKLEKLIINSVTKSESGQHTKQTGEKDRETVRLFFSITTFSEVRNSGVFTFNIYFHVAPFPSSSHAIKRRRGRKRSRKRSATQHHLHAGSSDRSQQKTKQQIQREHWALETRSNILLIVYNSNSHPSPVSHSACIRPLPFIIISVNVI